MDNPRFDIYLTGKLATGLSAAEATERLAQLFRSTPDAMRALVSGKPQLLKRGVEQATAAKYRDALHRAGLEVTIRPQAEAAATLSPVPTSVAEASITKESPTSAQTELSLAPYGTEVLREEERPAVVAVVIDTDHLSLQSERPRFGPVDTPLAAELFKPPALDAGGLTLAPADRDLLRPEEKAITTSAVADVPDLTLAEPGALLETLPVHTEFVLPDISALTLAPSGTDLLLPSEVAPAKPVVVPDISKLRLID